MSAAPSVDAVVLHASDNVATALHPLEAGETAVVKGPGVSIEVVVHEAIARCHKLAVADLPAGAPVRKYGEVIGAATARIAAGTLVHVHNLRSLRAVGGR